LVGIIEDHDLGSPSRSLTGPLQPLWILHDDGFGNEAAVHVTLVAPIAPEQDSGPQAVSHVTLGDP
jgi:hypothetical protein